MRILFYGNIHVMFYSISISTCCSKEFLFLVIITVGGGLFSLLFVPPIFQH